MKQIIKKLFLNIKYLINWQHSFFYLFLVYTVFHFIFADYNLETNTLNYNNLFYSLGKSIILSLGVSLTSMLLGIILVLVYLTKSIKIIKTTLDNIFILPEILYLFILLFLLSPINIIDFIIILSIIRGYNFSNLLIQEIEEIKKKEFINALYSMGLKKSEIIRKHVLPIITIPIAIFFIETVTWFIVIEFILSFINITPIYKYPAIGTMMNNFISNKNYTDLYIIIIIFYLFTFELSYIITNIKLKFEILFKKET